MAGASGRGRKDLDHHYYILLSGTRGTTNQDCHCDLAFSAIRTVVWGGGSCGGKGGKLQICFTTPALCTRSLTKFDRAAVRNSDGSPRLRARVRCRSWLPMCARRRRRGVWVCGAHRCMSSSRPVSSRPLCDTVREPRNDTKVRTQISDVRSQSSHPAMYGVAKLQYSIVNTQIRHTNILEPAPTSSSTPLPAPPTGHRPPSCVTCRPIWSDILLSSRAGTGSSLQGAAERERLLPCHPWLVG